MTEEKLARLRPITWTKNHIKKKSAAYKEGAAAAVVGSSIEACPYNGWTSSNQILRINWCAGFSSIKHPKIKRAKDGQVDLEDWLKAR